MAFRGNGTNGSVMLEWAWSYWKNCLTVELDFEVLYMLKLYPVNLFTFSCLQKM